MQETETFLLHGVELLQLAQIENSYTSGAPALNARFIRDTEATTHTRLTMTEEPNSDPLFPPEND